MSFEYSFEKLIVWKDAKELALLAYKLTGLFPKEEKYGLTNQIRRSAVSVSSNLAEGTSRNTNKDKAHYTTMAFSSLMELLNQFIISKELKYLSEDGYVKTRELIEKISNKLNALRKSQSNS